MTGQLVRVTRPGQEPMIGRLGYVGDWMSYVHLPGGVEDVIENSALGLLVISDPTGLTTGRWRVKRKTLIHNGAASVYVFRAEPIPARGVTAAAVESSARDFPRFEQALAYATQQAARNLR